MKQIVAGFIACMVISVAAFVPSNQVNAQTGRADTFVFRSDKDTYIVKDNTAGHNENRVVVRSEKSGSGVVQADERGLFHFDMSSQAALLTEEAIASATVSLTFRTRPSINSLRDGMDLPFWAYRTDRLRWNEDQATWYAATGNSCRRSGDADCTYWNAPGGDPTTSNALLTKQQGKMRGSGSCDNGTCTVSFDASNFVNDAVLNREHRVSLIILAEGAGNAPIVGQFYSHEVQNNDYHPRLTVKLDLSEQGNPCPVDIAFLMDNSGSMDDHGADVNLSRLSKRLKNYFRPTFNGSEPDTHKAALWHFSYGGNATQRVQYGDANSLERSIRRMGQADFDASGSDYEDGLRKASDRARDRSSLGRKQFIFFGGDEQLGSLSQAMRKRIRRDKTEYNISYYTFALRPDGADALYKQIRDVAGGVNSRFFKSDEFDKNNSLTNALNAQSCAISGVKFHDKNGNGVREISDDAAATEPGLGGWTVRLVDKDGKKVGADQVTSSDSDSLGYYEFNALQVGQRYRVEEIMTPDQVAEGWRQTTTDTLASAGERSLRNIGNTGVSTGTGQSIVTTGKSAQPDVLRGTNFETNVTVTASIDDYPLTSFSLTEKLASNLVFAQQAAAIKGQYTDSSGVTSEFDLTTQPAANATEWKIEPTDTGRTFEPGQISVTFKARYTKTQAGEFPIDQSDPANCVTTSRVEFKDVSSPTVRCVVVPAGNLIRENATLTIMGDALLQDRSSNLVFDGNTLAIGKNSLLVSGGNVTASGALNVTNYDVPTTGKLKWSAIWSKLETRVSRAKQSGAKNWCPGNITGDIYLHTDGANPTVPPTSGNTKTSGIWNVAPGCNLILGGAQGVVRLHGNGTVINDESVTRITGTITPNDSKSVLAVISNKNIVVTDQAAPTNVALVTNGQLELAQPDASVANPQSKDYAAYLIANTLRFPARGSLRASVTVRPAYDLRAMVPPLLEEFSLPGSQFLQ